MEQQWYVKNQLSVDPQIFSSWINILYVGSPHMSRNDPIHTAAPPPLSTHHTRLSTVPDGNLLQIKTTRQTVICHFTNQPTSSCLTIQRRRTFKLLHSLRTEEFKFPTSSAPVCIRGTDLRFHTCHWMPYVV